jgi:hypothetical protein
MAGNTVRKRFVIDQLNEGIQLGSADTKFLGCMASDLGLVPCHDFPMLHGHVVNDIGVVAGDNKLTLMAMVKQLVHHHINAIQTQAILKLVNQEHRLALIQGDKA